MKKEREKERGREILGFLKTNILTFSVILIIVFSVAVLAGDIVFKEGSIESIGNVSADSISSSGKIYSPEIWGGLGTGYMTLGSSGVEFNSWNLVMGGNSITGVGSLGGTGGTLSTNGDPWYLDYGFQAPVLIAGNYLSSDSGAIFSDGTGVLTADDMYAYNYYTLTDVYDKNEGSALSQLKDAAELKNADGSINHQAFGYSYEKKDVKVLAGYKDIFNSSEDVIAQVPVYESGEVEVVNLVKENSLLRQAVYELSVKLNKICSNQPSLC